MPVGLVEVAFGTNVSHIDHFKVADDLQGKGYGREMYQWLENYARERGVIQVILHVYQPTTGFWEKMGFKPDGLKKGNMVKVLT